MSSINDVLDGLRLQSSVFCRMTLSGDWGFAKDALSGAPFHLMLSGSAWLLKDEVALRLDPGDVVVLPHGSEHRLVSEPDAEAVPFREVADSRGLAPWTPGTRYKSVDLRFGSGCVRTTLISGVFAFGDHRRNPLLGALPPVLLIRRATVSPAARTIAAIAALLDRELLSGRPGAESVAARFSDLLLVEIVRHHLASAEKLPKGWLSGLADEEIAPALALMHRTPDQPWSVASLARELAMSRSRFAARFQEAVGQGPLEYLTELRMFRAAGRLGEGRIALPALAASVGYSSDIAFSKAFKRWAGHSPAAYRRLVASPSSSAEATHEA